MKDDVSSPPTPVDPAQRSLVDDMRELADAGKGLAQAELAYQKARASFVGKSVRNIAVLVVLVLALLFCALLSLTLGLILSLAPLLTPIGATAAVVAGFAISAVLGAMLAFNHWRRVKDVLREPGADDA
jgi:uncharacterized membrane protein YccC